MDQNEKEELTEEYMNLEIERCGLIDDLEEVKKEINNGSKNIKSMAETMGRKK